MNYLLTIIALMLAGHQSVSQNRNLDEFSYSNEDSIGITEQLKIAKHLYSLQLYDSVISLSEIILSQSLDRNYIRGAGEAYFLKARGLVRLGRREKAIEMYDLALERFESIEDPDRLASAYNNQGILFRAGGDFRAAIRAGEQALQHVSPSENNQLKFNILNNLGNSYQRIALFKKAGDAYFDALQLLQDIDNFSNKDRMEAEVSINLGTIYFEQRLFKESIDIYKRAKTIFERQDLKPQLANLHNNIAVTYIGTGDFTYAEDNLRESLRIYQEVNDTIGMAINLDTSGDMYFKQQKYREAIICYKKAIAQFGIHAAHSYLPSTYLGLGNTYLALGDSKNSYLSLIKGIQLALKSGQKVTELQLYEGLISYYKSTEQLELAILYYDLHAILSKEINDQQIGRHIGQLELKQLLTKRDQALKSLESETAMLHFQVGRKNLLLTLSIGLLLLSTALFYLLFRQYKLRAQNKRVILEQKILRTQLNPHFIFNVLGAIQHYSIINAPEKAAKYLSKFSKLMRAFLENSRRDQIELIQELETLRNYLDLQALRFSSHFEYEIKVDENLDQKNIQIPSMITQPLVENAIEHGLIPQNGGKLSIAVLRTSAGFSIRIMDNGVGLSDSEKTGLKKRSGLGIFITRERVSLLNKGKRKKISFNLENRSFNKSSTRGTYAELILPIR